MRDQYVGDLSDVIKFAFLRAIAGEDIRLGISWYYLSQNDGGKDGRHIEWRDEPAWYDLDRTLCEGLTALSGRSVAALERTPIWPPSTRFYREEVPSGKDRRDWVSRMCYELEDCDLVFLDPDNGLAEEATEKHATIFDLRALMRPGRSVSFIMFPGRTVSHDRQMLDLHNKLFELLLTSSVLTLRTTVSVPANASTNTLVPRPRWFTVINPSSNLISPAKIFTDAFREIPRARAYFDILQ